MSAHTWKFLFHSVYHEKQDRTVKAPRQQLACRILCQWWQHYMVVWWVISVVGSRMPQLCFLEAGGLSKKPEFFGGHCDNSSIFEWNNSLTACKDSQYEFIGITIFIHLFIHSFIHSHTSMSHSLVTMAMFCCTVKRVKLHRAQHCPYFPAFLFIVWTHSPNIQLSPPFVTQWGGYSLWLIWVGMKTDVLTAGGTVLAVMLYKAWTRT